MGVSGFWEKIYREYREGEREEGKWILFSKFLALYHKWFKTME